ncbi:MAG: cytochrome c [Alphaproteobacteria bacterium]|nr:cytochrome c [Alphaproteobacteria bacterium]MCB9796859.1 cytochrome c [Alphaproteobacteria bacterium]
MSLLVLMLFACGSRSAQVPAVSAPADPALTSEAPPRTSPLQEVASFAGTVADRGALIPGEDPWGEVYTEVRYPDQNWGPPETLWYYFADQGSRLIRRDILMNLELADSAAPLASTETFLRYRYLPQVVTPNNPDGLPVGFARGGDSIGLTCAACHTGQLIYEDTALRLDGAPALGDMLGLFAEIQASLRATLEDEAKQARFMTALGVAGDAEAEAAARVELSRALLFFDSYNATFEEVPGGYGRVDAIGGIVNQVIRFTSGTANLLSADAPTSYPLLWDAPRHDFVQWAGFSDNSGPGSISRNAGEVVGVFGDVHATALHTEKENDGGYQTSIQGHDLVDMEETLWKLQSPVWPEDLLPEIDRELAARGEALYAQECASCHALIDRDDPARLVKAQVYGHELLGTDPLTADNLADAWLPSGVLEGSLRADGSGVYEAEVTGLDLLGALVFNSLKQNKAAALRTVANAKRWGLESGPKQGDFPQDTEEDPYASYRTYKARPLNGVWASSPYLHNGSVPTLYDLLLPVEERPARFAVGQWTFDPVKVGYVYDGELPWIFDTSVPGNRNTGHLYGTAWSDEERWAVVEYLKTL